MNPGGGASPWAMSSARRRPGRGHRALASLYRAGKVPAVVTQNIDNLHQDSGIAPEHVVELHGNTTYALCLDCEQRYELAWVRERMDAGNGCAPDCPGLRRLHQDRDHIVRSGDARYRNAACPGSDACAAICFWRSAPRWWFGRRPDFP